MESRRALTAAAVALLASLAFQGLVIASGGGNWRYLFYTGAARELPPSMGAADIARAPDPTGFDGQYYHIVAHDPWLTGDTEGYVDNPRVRWRRILVPALAWLLAFGQTGFISAAYVLVVLGFTVLGVFWCARLAQLTGYSPWLGLAFLALPATFVSLDRMTIDVALGALTAGYALYLRTNSYGKLAVTLTLAPLVRETGLLLLAGYCLWRLVNRHTVPVFAAASAALPTLAWYAYVHSRTGPDSTPWVAAWPFSGLLGGLSAARFGVGGLGAQIALGLDLLALAGILLAIAATLRVVLPQPPDALAWSALLFIPLAAILGKADVWEQTYAFARIFSPLLLLLGVFALDRRAWWWALAWAVAAPRLAWQCALYLLAASRA